MTPNTSRISSSPSPRSIGLTQPSLCIQLHNYTHVNTHAHTHAHVFIQHALSPAQPAPLPLLLPLLLHLHLFCLAVANSCNFFLLPFFLSSVFSCSLSSSYQGKATHCSLAWYLSLTVLLETKTRGLLDDSSVCPSKVHTWTQLGSLLSHIIYTFLVRPQL
ncbi:Uncharacterized protein HZ326_17213 [Fusarium oxysporum f. sp. albedinis]|nr:Uncharacterized protein HZ326_17213 [Fusarium oxysporum f. sp. albedinis]